MNHRIHRQLQVLSLVLLVIVSTPLPCAQSTHYRHNRVDLLNDLQVTPGAIRSSAVSEICGISTASVRHVTPAMKKRVCNSYGIPAARCNGRNFEIDHLIPLELGGSNELTTLWPQPFSPHPGAREKDVLENFFHRQVCSGQMSMRAAQHAIAQDWLSAWKHMVTSPH
jgi:hypothetical protein